MPAPPPTTTTRAATRRAVLGGTLAGLAALSACDLNDLDPRKDADPASAATTGAPVDADQDLVDEVVTELVRIAALVGAVRARFPRLRRPMAPLLALHAAHLGALGGDVPEPAAAAGQTTAAAALRDIRTQESRLQRRLADWSVAAESGTLARLLASMSAAVAQQLAAA
ncbi:MAG: hypothetical protein JWO11_4033 [Nocardioides sp.]|nr:hypothetical protein [Nocardioides sp.]